MMRCFFFCFFLVVCWRNSSIFWEMCWCDTLLMHSDQSQAPVTHEMQPPGAGLCTPSVNLKAAQCFMILWDYILRLWKVTTAVVLYFDNHGINSRQNDWEFRMTGGVNMKLELKDWTDPPGLFFRLCGGSAGCPATSWLQLPTKVTVLG